MTLLFYVIRLKLIHVWERPGRLFWYLVFIILAIYNGYLLASVSDEYFSKDQSNLILSILLMISVLFRRGTFSSLQLVKIIKNYHPFSSFQRYMVNLVNDAFLNIFFLSTVCFVLTFQVFQDGLDNWIWYTFILFSSYISRRALLSTILQMPKFYRTKSRILFSWIIIIIFWILGWKQVGDPSIYLVLLALTGMMISGYHIEEKWTIPSVAQSTYTNPDFHTSFALLIRNRKVRTYLVLLFTVKIAFLIAFIVGYKWKHKPELIPFIFLFSSPVFAFNYLLNNSFGFMRRYWFFVDGSTSSGKAIAGHFLSRWWFVLAVDALISIVFVLVFQEWIIPLLFSYVVLLITFTSLCFYWSVAFPVMVNPSLFNVKPVAGILPAIVSAGLTLPFVFAYKIPILFYGAGIILLILSLAIWSGFDNYYHKHRQGVFSTLFK